MGIVNLGMNLRDVVARWAAFVSEISEHKYGHAPLIKASKDDKNCRRLLLLLFVSKISEHK